MNEQRYTAEQLSSLAGVTRRTIRYYIKEGLLERPIGETKSAYYTARHLEHLLAIRRFANEGLRLERIHNIMENRRRLEDGKPISVPTQSPQTLEIWSHFTIGPGLKLLIEPGTAGIAPEDLRSFALKVIQSYQDIITKQDEEQK